MKCQPKHHIKLVVTCALHTKPGHVTISKAQDMMVYVVAATNVDWGITVQWVVAAETGVVSDLHMSLKQWHPNCNHSKF